MFKNKMTNGCSYSNLFIYPNLHKVSAKEAMKKEWYVGCKFFDPDAIAKYPNGYFWRKKNLAEYKTFKEKSFAAKILLEEMQIALDRFYNPIPYKRYFQLLENDDDYSPNLLLIESLDLAFKDHSQNISSGYAKSIESNLNTIKPIIFKLNFDTLKIKDVELKHVKKILDNCEISAYSYNKFRKHLSVLFKMLCSNSCLIQNPCDHIPIKSHIKKEKKILSGEEFEKVYEHLMKFQPDFANYAQIFHLSGCRSTELLGVKKSDVNIEKQEFVITVKKRKTQVREIRAIIKDAIPFWEKQLEKCLTDEYYLFGYKFAPELRQTALISDRPGKTWKKYIMDPFKINVTFYALKYMFLDKVAELHGMEAAQNMAGHLNGKTTEIYTTFKKQRELEILKKLSINDNESSMIV